MGGRRAAEPELQAVEEVRSPLGLSGLVAKRAAPAPGFLPRHVAIIMDGNGRWAAAKGLPRFEGHRRGLEALRGAVRSAIEIGIEYLTIYSFSSENWSRPQAEVMELMGLLKRFIRHDLADLHRRVGVGAADLAGGASALSRQLQAGEAR